MYYCFTDIHSANPNKGMAKTVWKRLSNSCRPITASLAIIFPLIAFLPQQIFVCQSAMEFTRTQIAAVPSFVALRKPPSLRTALKEGRSTPEKRNAENHVLQVRRFTMEILGIFLKLLPPSESLTLRAFPVHHDFLLFRPAGLWCYRCWWWSLGALHGLQAREGRWGKQRVCIWKRQQTWW